MTSTRQDVQADGGGTHKGASDGVGEPATHGKGLTGESGGGAYPNPHTGKGHPEDGPDGFLGSGGQSGIAYHGGSQLGEEKADKDAPGRTGQGG
jgi:hypothetical protein